MADEPKTAVQPPPIGLDWQTYVRHFVDQTGGWAQLSDELLRRSRGTVDAPTDPQSVQKGLRRLASRENKPGGQYGRWMVRHFGLPEDTERWVRYLGQYHRRFADLPTSLRLQQLRIWDRPPVTESSLKAWIDVGVASVFHRMRQLEDCRARLVHAQNGAERAGTAAMLEVLLFRARLASDAKDWELTETLFSEVEALLAEKHAELERQDDLCYRSRFAGQRAYVLNRADGSSDDDVVAARRLFEGLEEPLDVPFACYQRAAGLAYCSWRLGDVETAIPLARRALDFAGDAGLVRFRVMALNQLAKMVPDDEALELRTRAKRMSEQLEDEDLEWRVQHHAALGRR